MSTKDVSMKKGGAPMVNELPKETGSHPLSSIETQLPGASTPTQTNMASTSLPPPQPSYNYNNSSNGATPTAGVPGLYQNSNMNGATPTAGVPGPYQNSNTNMPVAKAPLAPQGVYREKSVLEAYLLAVSPFGIIGAHHFYLRRYYWGLVYFFTLGLMGFGYLIDWFRVPCLVKEANAKLAGTRPENKKTKSDAYTMWFPFGLLGFHHFYLGNYLWGSIYFCTFGLCGIGWIVDAFRIPYMVREANKMQSLTQPREKSACATVALGLSPLGIVGGHHYYLDRPIWGVLYTITGGLMGLGWVFDWFRMPLLISRANKVVRGTRSPGLRSVDDAYLLWLPWGFLGFHHFYLDRPLWGILYLCTLGIAGLGWLIDACRIPFLVSDYNKRHLEQLENQALAASVSQQVTTVTITTHNQGYSNYGMANPVAYTQNGLPPAPYPPQGNYYQQQGYAYGMPQTPQNGQPPSYTAGISGPQYPPPMGGPAPPPYEPQAPNHVGQQAGEMPRKH